MSLGRGMGPDRSPPPPAEIIDLAALSGPAGRAIPIYDRILNGQTPSPGELDDALTALREAPRPTGRLGRDITLLVESGRNTTAAHINDAFERLRLITAIKPSPPEFAPARVPARRKPKHANDQQPLPGLFEELDRSTP